MGFLCNLIMFYFDNGKYIRNIICDELDALGKSIGVMIKCQQEEIFNSMHRI